MIGDVSRMTQSRPETGPVFLASDLNPMRQPPAADRRAAAGVIASIRKPRGAPTGLMIAGIAGGLLGRDALYSIPAWRACGPSIAALCRLVPVFEGWAGRGSRRGLPRVRTAGIDLIGCAGIAGLPSECLYQPVPEPALRSAGIGEECPVHVEVRHLPGAGFVGRPLGQLVAVGVAGGSEPDP